MATSPVTTPTEPYSAVQSLCNVYAPNECTPSTLAIAAVVYALSIVTFGLFSAAAFAICAVIDCVKGESEEKISLVSQGIIDPSYDEEKAKLAKEREESKRATEQKLRELKAEREETERITKQKLERLETQRELIEAEADRDAEARKASNQTYQKNRKKIEDQWNKGQDVLLKTYSASKEAALSKWENLSRQKAAEYSRVNRQKITVPLLLEQERDKKLTATASKYAALKQDLGASLKQLGLEAQSLCDIDELGNAQRRLEELRKEHAELEAQEKEALAQLHSSYEQSLEAKMAEIETNLSRLKSEQTDLRQLYDVKQRQLDSDYQSDLDTLEATFQSQLDALAALREQRKN